MLVSGERGKLPRSTIFLNLDLERKLELKLLKT